MTRHRRMQRKSKAEIKQNKNRFLFVPFWTIAAYKMTSHLHHLRYFSELLENIFF